MLADVGPPIVPVWSTTDRDGALLWYEALEGTGAEGIVAKPLRSAYRAGRVWSKIRHADTVDATVVGFTGTPGIRRRSPYGCLTDASRCPSG